jgi:hypothetical protein
MEVFSGSYFLGVAKMTYPCEPGAKPRKPPKIETLDDLGGSQAGAPAAFARGQNEICHGVTGASGPKFRL